MSSLNEKLVSWLFKTNAIRVCPEDKPFWYTSGTIGPYYINTHFLIGSEEKANQVLNIIDTEKDDKIGLPSKLLQTFSEIYSSDRIYKPLIDSMVEFIKDGININEIDYISGGERRDWFFSFIIAKILNKPHITIYKDLDSMIFDNGEVFKKSIEGEKVLHIADLVTEASSFERAWIPAVEDMGGKINWSVVVVDRMQGGAELLKSKGVNSYSMIDVNKELFKEALTLKYINYEQYSMISDYIDNPKQSMKEFINKHPEFIQNALKSDIKTQQRAQLCLDKNIYNF